jgi:DNA-binding MarR family transcriptional regulator
MQASFGQRQADGDERLERAIVLRLLTEERRQSWSPGQLAAELAADRSTLECALDRLNEAGVVELAGRDVRASRAAQRIDELGLIGI